MGRTRLITARRFAGSLGWGTILPFQYAYVVDARALGRPAGMLAGTTVLPRRRRRRPAGRPPRRPVLRPHAVVVFPLIAAVSAVAWALAGTPGHVPRRRSPCSAPPSPLPPRPPRCSCSTVSPRRRAASVFAYQFTAHGARHGGRRLRRRARRRPRHHRAACGPPSRWRPLGFAASAACSLLPRRGHHAARQLAPTTSRPPTSPEATLADLPVPARQPAGPAARPGVDRAGGRLLRPVRDRPARVRAAVAAASTPPSSAPRQAVNCVVIVGLQWLVVRLTGDRSGAALLVVVGAIWVVSWLLLEVALFTVAAASPGALFVVAFVIFAVGETMYAPVLSPLAAAVAPAGTRRYDARRAGRAAHRDQRRRAARGRRCCWRSTSRTSSCWLHVASTRWRSCWRCGCAALSRLGTGCLPGRVTSSAGRGARARWIMAETDRR